MLGGFPMSSHLNWWSSYLGCVPAFASPDIPETWGRALQIRGDAGDGARDRRGMLAGA